MSWLRRLRSTLFGSTHDEEFAEEMQFHLDERIDEYVKGGMPYEQARLEAQRRLGSVALTRDQVRDVDTFRWLRDVGRDVRYALRVMSRTPSFALAVVSVLALGIGANTTIFSIVNAVLLRPLPFEEPERLVQVFTRPPGGTPSDVSPGKFYDWQRDAQSFDGMAMYRCCGLK